MKWLFRRLRGVISTAITWSVGWAGIGTVLALGSGLPLRFLGMAAFGGIVSGAIAGGSFAVILSIAERRSTLANLSLKRVALWGGIGGLILASLPMAFGLPIGLMIRSFVTYGLTGAAFASGSVALAKRADSKELTKGREISTLQLQGD